MIQDRSAALIEPSAAVESTIARPQPRQADHTHANPVLAKSWGDYLSPIPRHKSIAIAVFALTTLVVLESFSSAHRYEATARLTLDADAPHTDLQTLASADTARRVLAQLDLEGVPEYDDTSASSSWRTLTAIVGLSSPQTDRPASDRARHSRGDTDENVDRFVSRVRVIRVGGSRFVDVTFTALDSQFAKRAVNALVDEYVQDGQHSRTSQVVDRAEVTRLASSAIGAEALAVALALGLALALAAVFAVDYVNDTVSTPEEITRRFNLDVLGSVPSVASGDTYPLFASSQAPGDFAESFRVIRAGLITRYPQAGAKLLAITSAGRLEGKTMAAANIAMALADAGGRVLVIDGDMRQPALQRPLRLTNERGLSQVLTGQARVRDVIQRTVDPNLLAITAGRPPGNPSELLSSERMKTLLTTLTHGAFDWILIDMPALLTEMDAAILATSMTGVVYVIRAEVTRRRLAERALQTIRSAGATSVAIVLNRSVARRRRHNGSQAAR